MEASMVIGHLRFLFPVFNLSTDLYATYETQKGMEENINILFRSFANSSYNKKIQDLPGFGGKIGCGSSITKPEMCE